jgi:hypothetical protein
MAFLQGDVQLQSSIRHAEQLSDFKHPYNRYDWGKCSIAGSEAFFALPELCAFGPLFRNDLRHWRVPETSALRFASLRLFGPSRVGGGPDLMR